MKQPDKIRVLPKNEAEDIIEASDVLWVFDVLTHCVGDPDSQIIQEIVSCINALLPGGKVDFTVDQHNNLHISVGENNRTLFCAHHDTATFKNSSVQKIVYEEDGVLMMGTDGSTILGADDRAGAAVLVCMIAAGVPGDYIFFADEEIGRIGSEKYAKTLDVGRYDRAIQFDRYGTQSIITHQMGERTCSEEFCSALAEMLGMGMSADNGGTYTDTYSLRREIPECTNISIGYYGQHSPRESQDLMFLAAITEACLVADWDSLPTVRDPGESEIWSRYDALDDMYAYDLSVNESLEDVIYQLIRYAPQELSMLVSTDADIMLASRIRELYEDMLLGRV